MKCVKKRERDFNSLHILDTKCVNENVRYLSSSKIQIIMSIAILKIISQTSF